jgi:hypothetical protein
MLDVRLKDGKGEGNDAHVHTRGKNSGLVVYTTPLFEPSRSVLALTNEIFGADMNQNIAFGGTPELILDGGSGGIQWAATAIQGTWDFAATGKVTITNAANNDTAKWDDAGTIDMTNYTALTGLVDLDTYDGSNDSIFVQFGLAGNPLGVALNLNDYIDTGDFTEQPFVIPKDDFQVGTLTVDELTITINRNTGPKPDIKFDDFQIEETGTPAVYDFSPQAQEKRRVETLRIVIADVATTAEAADYNAIMNTAALPNGITFSAQSFGKTVFSGTFNRLIDLLSLPNAELTIDGDGTNSFLLITLNFREVPIVLQGKDEDFISATIADDLTGLLFMRMFVTLIQDEDEDLAAPRLSNGN